MRFDILCNAEKEEDIDYLYTDIYYSLTENSLVFLKLQYDIAVYFYPIKRVCRQPTAKLHAQVTLAVKRLEFLK